MIMQSIKAFMLKRDLTQADLANEVGVTQGMVSLWLSGRKRPSLDNLLSLSRITGVRIEELISDVTHLIESETESKPT